MTKAQEIRARADKLIAEGKPRSDALKQLAAELNIKPDSVRSAYYTAAKAGDDGPGRSSRPRRRSTSPADAFADARSALERAISAIDQECDAAEARAIEGRAEADEMKKSSQARKAEITKRLEALS